MVADVVMQTLARGLDEVRMSGAVLDATLALRTFFFERVYENDVATAEFAKATGILGGLWEKTREQPARFLDLRIVEAEGLDAAARDFLAGMTDRFAVRLFEELFIPAPWVEVRSP
jgi:dGTPase